MINYISEIDQFKGQWKAIGRLAPEQLLQLQKVATIESIASSTRIEGSVLSDKEVENLLQNLQIQQFETRDEQEVVGYAEVMNIVFANYADIPFSENYIKQLHALLLKHSQKDQWHKGQYKTSTNHVVAYNHAGENVGIVFETATPFETPFKMEELVNWTITEIQKKEIHPLIIVAVFIVEFLAIHPFQDGNGRLSRILTTLLLIQTGYEYVPYASLESIIELNKKEYYLALRQTQSSLKLNLPQLEIWILFFLKCMQKHKNKLHQKITNEQLILGSVNELSIQIIELLKQRGRATISDIEKVTNANRNTLKKTISALVIKKLIQKNGEGKGTHYSL